MFVKLKCNASGGNLDEERYMMFESLNQESAPEEELCILKKLTEISCSNTQSSEAKSPQRGFDQLLSMGPKSSVYL